MTKKTTGFHRRLTVMAGILLIAGGIAFSTFLKPFFLPAMPFLLLFFYAFTLLTFHYLIKAADKALLKFHKANMLVTLVRMLVYLAVIILCIAFRRENAVVIVAFVGFLYLVFTITEVIELSKYVRLTGRSKKDSETASANE